MDSDLRRVIKLTLVILLVSVVIPLLGFIPAVADGLNRQAVHWVSNDKPRPARMIFKYLHSLGIGEATNNLGVLNLLGIDQERNRNRAVGFFEQAVEKDVVAARYNLVLTMPNRFNTPRGIIKRQFALLDQNIEAGDVPSQVLAAERLYFANREDFVPNRNARKLALLKSAASTGDPDYLYQYGKELELQASLVDDARMMLVAIQAYRQAFEKGNFRGAEALSSVRSIRHWNAKPSREEALEKKASEWGLIAAEAGSITARCDYGIGHYRWMNELADTLQNSSLLREKLEAYQSQSETISGKKALAFLGECAKVKKRTWPANPPFGDTALYAYKRTGSVSALANSPEWANYYLGQLYALGLDVEKDFEKSRAHFKRAAKSGSFADSDVWIKHLDRLQTR